ncbi:MAG: LON peptidase substrate-binding domain-containing protein [Verrucomicrobiota bacterium]
MDSDLSFSLPDTVPGMTLPEVVLFPQATMPLYIFEPRYRKMLEDILDGNRLMVIATQDKERSQSEDLFEAYHPQATLGLVQSSQKNPDGTSSILVQGLLRVNAETTCQEEPYRIFAINPLESEAGDTSENLEKHANKLSALIQRRSELGNNLSREILRFFESIDDPEILADLVSFTLINNTASKLELLSALKVTQRFEILFEHLTEEIKHLELISKLKGKLDNERIDWN